MSKIKEINEYAAEVEEEIVIYDEFEDAIIGLADRFGMDTSVAYDYDKVIKILMEDMSYEEAVEHFDFNVIGGWVGDSTPVFIKVLGWTK